MHDTTNSISNFDPLSDTSSVVQTERVLNEIEFIDETQEEFDTRMIEVKKKWEELDKQLPKEEIFRRLEIYNESERILKEIPRILEWLEKKISPPDSAFERRLRRFKNGRRKTLE